MPSRRRWRGFVAASRPTPDELQAGRDRIAHATLLSTILDVLAGSSRAAEHRHRCSVRSATPNMPNAISSDDVRDAFGG
jgi:hypothetical protein